MLKNYLKIAVRNLFKHKGYSLINVSGLALGMACCIVILLVVRHQLSYDRFHQHSNRIYRVVQKVSWGSGDVWTGTSALLGPNLEKDFTEIESMTRINLRSVLVSYEEGKTPVRFQEERFGFADPAFFEIFAFSFVQNDPRTALAEPQSIVLTQAMAEKYFGKENPSGKTLRLDNQLDLQITGVLENVPSNSHLEFDFVAAFPALKRLMNVPEFTSWWWPDVNTYVRVTGAALVGRLNSEQLPAFIKRYREPDIAAAVVPQLQPVTDIHLYGATGNDGSIRYVYIFSVIAAFVLLIACINFMNLATARSIQRSREVGIRKVIGASRKQLVKQFLGESFFITFIAMFAGLALAELFLRVVNQMTGLSIAMNFGDAWLPLGLIGITIVVGLLSGSYPALFLSRFLPVRVLKGNTRIVAGGNRLRQGLVVFQFIISIVLIVGTLVVFNQLDFLRNKSLGFDKEQVVALPVHRDEVVRAGYGAFKNELLRSPGVVSVAATNSLPGAGRGEFMPAEIEGLTEKIGWTGRVLFVDYDFLRTMGIELVEGRDFSLNFPTDAEQAFILNETNMKGIRSEALKLGIPLQQPLTQNMRISYGEFGRVAFEKRGKIIGVAKDFHVTNPRFPITTAVLTIAGEGMQNRFSHFLVRVSPDRPRETLKHIEEVWNKHFSHRPFELVFIDEQLAQAYRADAMFGRIVGTFALLAVFIACLGLFGLTSFTVERRTKEIGPAFPFIIFKEGRGKVIGASMPGIAKLLSMEFLKLVVMANVIAWSLAYYAMNRWLQDFAYRIEIGVGIFLLTAAIAFTIALLTVSFQAIKAALANPVEALRYE